MNRSIWNSEWAKPAIDWFKQHSHKADFVPRDRATITDWAERGFRFIRRVGGNTPDGFILNGAILMWTAPNLPDGYEWVHELGATVVPQNT